MARMAEYELDCILNACLNRLEIPIDDQDNIEHQMVNVLTSNKQNINLMTTEGSPFEREMIQRYPQLNTLIRKVELGEEYESKLKEFVPQMKEIHRLVQYEQSKWRYQAEQKRYAESSNINNAYFENNNINEILRNSINKFASNNQSTSKVLQDICDKQLKLQIEAGICVIIEAYTRNNETLNIFRIDKDVLDNKIVDGMFSDKFWVQKHLLQSNSFNVFDSKFIWSDIIEKRQFRNFFNAKKNVGIRRLVNRKIKCGDIIQIVSGMPQCGFATMFFVIDTDDQTMVKIGMNRFDDGNINIIIPLHVTRTLHAPFKLYSRLLEMDVMHDMEIEFQIAKDQSYQYMDHKFPSNILLMDVHSVNDEFVSLKLQKQKTKSA